MPYARTSMSPSADSSSPCTTAPVSAHHDTRFNIVKVEQDFDVHIAERDGFGYQGPIPDIKVVVHMPVAEDRAIMQELRDAIRMGADAIEAINAKSAADGDRAPGAASTCNPPGWFRLCAMFALHLWVVRAACITLERGKIDFEMGSALVFTCLTGVWLSCGLLTRLAHRVTGHHVANDLGQVFVAFTVLVLVSLSAWVAASVFISGMYQYIIHDGK